MTTKDQAMAIALFNTWVSRQRNWTDILRAQAWAAFQEGYYQAPQSKPTPDCRSCKWKDHCKGGVDMACTNGNEHEAAPAMVLWKTK
jgi:radical SAM protein with 4Fe4S-binding SPASM domain